MDYAYCVLKNVKYFYNSINPATLSRAIVVVVVEQPNGEYKSTPFHVRFGKYGVFSYPGPSNHDDLGLPTTHKFRQTSTGRTMKQTWTCEVCRKELSSKRSCTEHKNIHNKSRPFPCEHRTYAAASQMTLHRHKLRNHTPKTEWGYRCPYCD